MRGCTPPGKLWEEEKKKAIYTSVKPEMDVARRTSRDRYCARVKRSRARTRVYPDNESSSLSISLSLGSARRGFFSETSRGIYGEEYFRVRARNTILGRVSNILGAIYARAFRGGFMRVRHVTPHARSADNNRVSCISNCERRGRVVERRGDPSFLLRGGGGGTDAPYPRAG